MNKIKKYKRKGLVLRNDEWKLGNARNEDNKLNLEFELAQQQQDDDHDVDDDDENEERNVCNSKIN